MKEDIVKVMQTVVTSMDSHLPYCIDTPGSCESCENETPEFHRSTVKEYIETLHTLSKYL